MIPKYQAESLDTGEIVEGFFIGNWEDKRGEFKSVIFVNSQNVVEIDEETLMVSFDKIHWLRFSLVEALIAVHTAEYEEVLNNIGEILT